MQDFEFKDDIAAAIGMEVDSASATEETLGQDRLGNGSFFSSLGVSIILVSVICLSIFIIITTIVCIGKKVLGNPKWSRSL